MQYLLLPLAIFFIIFYPKILTKAIFYNRLTGQWHLKKKWHYYFVYSLFTVFFFFVCSIPYSPNTYVQIRNFYVLHSEDRNFVECYEKGKNLSKDLPDTEFELVYEIKKSVKPEDFVYEIIPEIIKFQSGFSEWHVFNNHDFRIKNYSIQYDSANNVFLLCLNKEVAAEIKVKKTLFFKKIYFHGYWTVYQKYQKNQN